MITTFGEIMLRIQPEKSGERIRQASQFRITPGGSESNVAIALSNLGLKTAFITSLPDNHLADIIIQYLRQYGVNTKYIKTKDKRLGVYWTENGVGPRNSFVIYDRNDSSFSSSEYNDFNFDEVFKRSSWFHFSGISPAVSKSVAELISQIVISCHCPYSVDLNFREKLWEWLDKDKVKIKGIMTKLCEKAALIAGNETDFTNVLGFVSNETDITKAYADIAKQCFKLFPKTRYVSISSRESKSATLNNWTGFLFVNEDKNFVYKGLDFAIDNILDRVGTGDSFMAGIIYGLTNPKRFSFQQTVDFAVALSALNHTTLGDASHFEEKEVTKAIQSGGSGRIIR